MTWYLVIFGLVIFVASEWNLVRFSIIPWRLFQIPFVASTYARTNAISRAREATITETSPDRNGDDQNSNMSKRQNASHYHSGITVAWSRFYESSQQRYANVATVTWLARHFETVKFPITSSPRARPSNWAKAELYRYKIVAVSLHKTHICVVKSLVKIAAVSWHSLRRVIKPAPGQNAGQKDEKLHT